MVPAGAGEPHSASQSALYTLTWIPGAQGPRQPAVTEALLSTSILGWKEVLPSKCLRREDPKQRTKQVLAVQPVGYEGVSCSRYGGGLTSPPKGATSLWGWARGGGTKEEGRRRWRPRSALELVR